MQEKGRETTVKPVLSNHLSSRATISDPLKGKKEDLFLY